MNSTAMLIAVLATLPAIGMVTWAWFVMTQTEEDLRTFSGSEELEFVV